MHKNIAILGKSKDMVSERAHEYYKQSESLIIGDIEHGFSLDDLNVLQGMVDDSTRIDIFAHGGISNGSHSILSNDDHLFTKYVLQILRSYNESSKLLIHLWSCYGGTASKDAVVLAKGSVLITHAFDDYPMIGVLANFAFRPTLSVDNHFATFASEFWSYSMQTSKFTMSIGDEQISSFNVAPKLTDLLIDSQQIILQIQNDFTSFAKQHDVVVSFRELSDQEIMDFTLGYFIYLCNIGRIDINEIFEYKDKLQSIINMSIDDFTPLNAAVVTGSTVLVEALLESGADVNSFPHTSPLIKAVVHKYEDMVKLLLQKGADVNSDSDILTPLSTAISTGNLQIGKILLENGANPNLLGTHDTTPLEFALALEAYDFIEVLRAYNAKGKTANVELVADFAIAVRQGNISMLKQLIDAVVLEMMDETCEPINSSIFDNFIGDFCPIEEYEEEYVTHVYDQHYSTPEILPSFNLH